MLFMSDLAASITLQKLTAPYFPVPGDAKAAGEFICPPGCWARAVPVSAATQRNAETIIIVRCLLVEFKRECNQMPLSTKKWN
jgi:hypothetical protein